MMKRVWTWDEWLARLEAAQARRTSSGRAFELVRSPDAPRTPAKREALERHDARRRKAGLPAMRGYSVLKGP